MSIAAGRDQGADIPADDWVEQDLLTRDLAADRLATLEADTLAELAVARSTPVADRKAVELLERRLRAIAASRAAIAPADPPER
jgi:hypothetical protein